MINDVKSYWDARPCNVNHARVSIDKDPLLFSKQVTERKYFVEPHILGFAQFERWTGKHVLDLGCGIGTDTIEFFRAGASVLGVDLSSESLSVAYTRLKSEGIDHGPLGSGASFMRCDMEKKRAGRLTDGRRGPPAIPGPMLERILQDRSLKMPLSSYDLVYSFGVIHHTPRPKAIMENVYQLLKPGGEFRMMVYNRRSWKAFWIIMTYGRGQFWKWKELIPKHSEAQTGCPITHTYTRKSVRALLEDAGFVVESIEVDHIFPYRIEDYKEHRYVKEWYWRLLPARVFRWLEKKIGWHLLVVARKPE
jgi:SAM-dependent methyltransferase